MASKGLLPWVSTTKLFLAILAAGLSLLFFAEPARAIPVFARKYGTSCITCHTIYPKLNDVGEAFRRNGYQFPLEDEVLVKEEPLKLGTDAYKAMFPNSIWPSTLPSIPPVSVFALSQNIVHLQPHGQLKKWDLAFPTDIELIGEGAFGTDISAFYDLGFTPADGAEVGRVFVQFSNLLAWDPEEDEDGCHDANRFCVLPPHFLNLRIGKIDPAVLPHVITQESLAQFPSLASSFTLGQTGFILSAEQPAVELSGIYRQYWSYAVGIANGGSAVGLAQDDNTFKDVYFNVTHRWFGYPLDGVLGQVVPSDKSASRSTPGQQYRRQRYRSSRPRLLAGLGLRHRFLRLVWQVQRPLGRRRLRPRTIIARLPTTISNGSASTGDGRGSTATLTGRYSGDMIHFPALTRTASPSARPITSVT